MTSIRERVSPVPMTEWHEVRQRRSDRGVHEFGPKCHHHGSLRFAGMLDAGLILKDFGRCPLKKGDVVCGRNGGTEFTGQFNGEGIQCTRIAAMTVDDHNPFEPRS